MYKILRSVYAGHIANPDWNPEEAWLPDELHNAHGQPEAAEAFAGVRRRTEHFRVPHGLGYGDAAPSNISSLVHGAEMRIAKTRAVNRALRKAYGIGLCSIEELGWSLRPSDVKQPSHDAPSANGNSSHQNGQLRLRDRLCLLIRQHRLDTGLVKAYAPPTIRLTPISEQ